MSHALGWVVIVAGTLATLAVISAALHWTLRPGERDPHHPKYLILRNDR